MSLVDTLEIVTASPATFPERLERYLHARFVELADAVYAAADQETGCWWQIMEFPGREGNYIESSGSAMFTYALYKGVRMGYLSGPGAGVDMGNRYTNLAEKCYAHLVEDFIVENPGNGMLGYNGTVGVCSMDSEATYEVSLFSFDLLLEIMILICFCSIMSRSLCWIIVSMERQRLRLPVWSMRCSIVVNSCTNIHRVYTRSGRG